MECKIGINLAQSSKIIDGTRSAGYIERGRAFSNAFAGALGVDLAFYGDQAETAGLRLAIINHLFEVASTRAGAERISDLIEPALRFPECKEVLDTFPKSEVDALKTRISFITSTGYEKLTSIDQELADNWLNEWQFSIRLLCVEETLKTYFRLGDSPSDYYSASSLEEGVGQFLADFSKTGASEVALIGNFPFTQNPTEGLLNLYRGVGDVISPVFRFAQDVFVNPAEKVNTGLFAYALVNGTSLDEARVAIADPVVRASLQSELGQIWNKYSVNQMSKLDDLLKYNPEYSSSLTGAVQMIHALVEELSTNWQQID